MTRLTRKAARSKGFDPVAAGYGGVRAPRGAVLSMALSLVIGLAWCGRAWGATDVEYHNPNTALTAYDDRNGSYYNTDPWHYDSEGDHQVPANAYKIQDGQLYRAVTNWSWSRNTIDGDPNEGRWTAVTNGAPVWTPVDWDKTINITSDLYDETFVSYGDVTGDDTITPTYKDSGNTVNISGNGAISGSLSLYDPGNNADYNTLNIGYHSGTGYNGTHIDGFELANSASGSVSGTVDVGRGYVYLYSGTVTTAGEIYARNGNTTFTQMDGDGMGAQSNGGDMSGTVYMNNDFAASFNYSYLHSAGTQNGIVYMNGDNNVNHYVFSGGTISGTGGIYMDGDGTTNRFSQTGGAASGETIHMDGHNSIWNIYQQTGGSNSNTVNIGDAATDLAGTTAHGGIFYVGGGTRSGAATVYGDNNLFWINNTANYAADASTVISSGVNSGNNVGVVDLKSGYAMAGTLDLSGTTSGQNNLFFANGDVTGAVTTSGTAGDPNESQTHAFVGYVAGQGYSWYNNNENYDLTGIALPDVNDTPAAVSNMPTGTPTGSASGYFAMNQINATAENNLNVKLIVGGGGELHAHVSAGDAYNIRDGSAAGNTEITHTPGLDATYGEYPYMYPFGYPYSPDENSLWHDIRTIGFVPYVTGTGATLNDLTYLYEQTTDYFNNGGYLTYSVLNQDVVNVGAYVDVNPANGGAAGLFLSPTNVTIGAIKDMTGTAVDIAAGDFNNAYNPIDLSSGEWIPGEHDNHTVDYYLRDENGDGVYDNYEGRAGAHQYSKWFDSYIVDEGGPGEKLVEHQAQITAGMVNVYAGSKLTIHPNVKEMGLADEAFRTANADSINIIENLNIIGMPDDPADCNDCGYTPYNPAKWAVVTIDRTTVYANTDGTKITHGTPGDGTIYYPGENDAGFYYANVVVGTNGILQGFGEKDPDSQSPLRPNVVGDVAVLAGGMLRPYDAHYEGKQVFNYEDKTWETIGDGGIFVVHGNALDSNAATHADYVDNVGGAFDLNADRLKGVVMKIDGTVYMEHASRVSTNLFADLDTDSDPLSIVSDGTDVRNDPVVVGRVPAGGALDVTRHKGDGIEATEKFVFDEIKYASAYLRNGVYDQSIAGTTYYSLADPKIWTGVAQHNKVQYVPSFGFVNELKTKLDYNIYWGDPVVQDGDATYYYQVTYNSGDSPEKIAALEGMPDANHLFNRDIVFSDMLGNWSFEKQANDMGVVLRYRQVAKHAQDGGIAIDQDIRNSQQVGYKLDEIRYPFLTAYNMNDPGLQGLFEADPSLDGSGVVTPYDAANAGDHEYAHYDGNPYDAEGFNGDIKEYYFLNQDRFTNYRDYWVEDIENYFRALQLNVASQADIYLSLRLLSAEPYASQISSDLSAMNRFIDNRERNGMSALWLVEEKRRMANEEMGVGRNGFDEDMPTAFVQNPLRVWATALGGNYRQKDVGDEYGYKNSGYGLQLGFIKEIGDAYFGLTGAYTSTKNKWSDLQADNKSDNYMAEALVGIRRGRYFLELSANGGYMDHSMTRDLTHGASLSGGPYDPQLDCNLDDNYYNGVYSVKHYADFHNRVLGGGLRLGYQKVLGEKWLFLPTIGVRFQDIRNPKSFHEKGKESASFRLVFDKGGMKRRSLQIPVMFRLSRGIAFNDGGPTILTPEVRVGATYEAMDRGGVADYQWIGNPIPNRTMRAWGIREDRLGLQAGATLELSRRGRFYAAMNYDVIYRDKGFSHNYSFQAGVNF